MVAIDDTVVNGRSGVSINESGAGNSSLTVGATTTVTIGSQLNIQDASGDSLVNLRRLIAGGLVYNDLGGGIDVFQGHSALAGEVGFSRGCGVLVQTVW